VKEFTDQDILEIYNGIVKKKEILTKPESPENTPIGNWGDWEKMDQNEIFDTMCTCIFTAGFKVSILEKKWPDIKKAFHNFKIDEVVTLNYSDLMKNDRIIRNRRKIKACIENAKRFQLIIKKHGTFHKYLKFLVNKGPQAASNTIKSDFCFMGDATAPQFLKDIGLFDTFKADVHVRRILSRIGLIPNEQANLETIENVFKRIQRLSKNTIGAIDGALFEYGSGTGLKKPICGTKPICSECYISGYCEYYNKHNCV